MDAKHTPILPHMWIDPAKPGMIRFGNPDDMAGILAGMIAADVVRACNAYGAIEKLCAELDQTADVDDGIPNEAMKVLTTIRHFIAH